jgi:hypothetical protein
VGVRVVGPSLHWAGAYRPAPDAPTRLGEDRFPPVRGYVGCDLEVGLQWLPRAARGRNGAGIRGIGGLGPSRALMRYKNDHGWLQMIAAICSGVVMALRAAGDGDSDSPFAALPEQLRCQSVGR